MKKLSVFTAILLLAAALFTACQKTEPVEPTPDAKIQPTLPEGNRIRINFGTSTYQGCMSTFSNCIWIGLENNLGMEANRPFMQTNDGAQMDKYFGAYFPLTADFKLNIEPQNGLPGSTTTIKAGLYPVSETSNGRIVYFDQVTANGQSFNVAPLINEGNPQDAIGNLHNLAMQVILTPENRKEMDALTNDKVALRAYILRKTEAFLNENDIFLQTGEADRIAKNGLAENYENYADAIAKSNLTAADQLVLRNIVDAGAQMPCTNLKELDAFVKFMTARETELATAGHLNDAKTVLSALSVMKYSRYYWFYHDLAKGNSDDAGRTAWWLADLKGLLTGGIGQAIVDSAMAWLA